MDATNVARMQIFDWATAGNAAILRALVRKEQPRTQSQIPEVRSDEAMAKRFSLRNLGPMLVSSHGAADYFAEMKFESEATESPCNPYPAPKLLEKPWPIPGAEVKGAAAEDAGRPMKMGSR